jgi:branched-chain amino acid transport system substrate-binding protein
VVEAEFKQVVARKGARVVAVERYPPDDAAKLQEPVRAIAQAAGRADALFIGDGGEQVPQVAQALASAGVNLKRLQLIGTGLWDDPRIFGSAAMEGGWYVGPDPNLQNGFRAFSTRYRARYGQDPVRTATLSYDAVALVAALVKSQGTQRFSDEVLAANSGFAGIDGVFRFRNDGTNQRGLAVLKVMPSGGQVIAPAPRTFGNSGT